MWYKDNSDLKFVQVTLLSASWPSSLIAGIASGSMMNSGPPSYSSTMSRGYDFNPNTPGNNEFSSGPLSHLSESVNSLDPLNAMEKSLNEQVCWI